MLANLTGSSWRRNTKEVFSHALAEPAVTWQPTSGRRRRKNTEQAQKHDLCVIFVGICFLRAVCFAPELNSDLRLKSGSVPLPQTHIQTQINKKINKIKTTTICSSSLTKVDELLHRQGRWRKLRKPIHLFRYPSHKVVFQQKLSELHFSPLPFADPNSETNSPFSLQHGPVWRLSASSVSYLWRASRKLWVPRCFCSLAASLHFTGCFVPLKFNCCAVLRVLLTVDGEGRGGGGGCRDWHQKQPIRTRAVLTLGGVILASRDAKRALRASPTDEVSELLIWFKLFFILRVKKPTDYVDIYGWNPQTSKPQIKSSLFVKVMRPKCWIIPVHLLDLAV